MHVSGTVHTYVNYKYNWLIFRSDLAVAYLLFRLKYTVAVVTHAHVLQNFYTTWVRGVACQKQHLRPKWRVSGPGEHPKKWDAF